MLTNNDISSKNNDLGVANISFISEILAAH